MSNKCKTRFDGLDVAAMTALIKRSLLGHKLANVYDGIALSSSLGSDSAGKGTFLFKLANPSSGSNANANTNTESSSTANDNKSGTKATTKTASTIIDTKRCMLLIESGVRFHTTTFYSPGESNAAPPSPFAMKLRKHLRNLRLENVTQLGNLDRVVDFRFGSGDNTHHLILELYGLGNIILTDAKYEILALLRLHEYSSKEEEKVENEQGNKEINNAKEVVEQVKVRVGNVYPVAYATTITSQHQQQNIESLEELQELKQQIPQLSEEEQLLQELEAETTKQNNSNNSTNIISMKHSLLDMNGEEAYQWAKQQLQKYNDIIQKQSDSSNNTKKKKKKKDNKDGSANLKMLLLKPNSGVFHYGPSLIEHCILFSNLEPTKKFNLESCESIMPLSSWDNLIDSLKNEGNRILSNFNTGDGKGYILYREKPSTTKNRAEEEEEGSEKKNNKKSKDDTALSDMIKKMPHSDKIFEEFQPHLLKQHEHKPKLSYDNFSVAVDEFFSLLEGQKRALRAEAAEQSAKERLEKIKKDQSKRMESLENEMVKLKEHAILVECHADDIDKALSVINSALDSGMDWEALSELVFVEKANMNPIALLIKRLDLDNDNVILSLPHTMSWDPSSDEGPSIVDVSVSIKEGAYSNARIMYDKYRSSKEKAGKTAEASDMALKAAEANAQRQIEQAQKNKNMTFSVMMQPQRKQHWFEKFLWFITSDNYLVLGGRDAQQNEMLVKRYLRPGDAYLHADVHGAPTCILRAKRRRTANGATEVLPLSDQALKEAGNFAICRSSAWGSRMVTSAWWVESHQVSKTAPTGEYLTVGSFMIRGKKKFLPPSSLEMGLGVLFRLGDDVSQARHANERRDFALIQLHESKAELEDIDPNKKSAEPSYDRNLGSAGDMSAGTSTSVKKGEKVPFTDSIQIEVDAEKEKEKKKEIVDSSTPSCKEMPKAEETPEKGDNINGAGKVADRQSQPSSKRKGLSAKDRKLIKKYGSLEAAEVVLTKLKKEEEERSLKKKATGKVKATKNTNENSDNNYRGKKSKMKKIAKKYADQDNEDRELALLALQGNKKTSKNKKGSRSSRSVTGMESSSQAKVASETAALLVRDASKFVNKLSKDVSDELAKCLISKGPSENEENVRWDKLDAEVLEQLAGLDSIDAQMAAAKRLHQLTLSTRIDNFSASLAGIIRTVTKYGYEGIQPIDNEVGGDGKQRKTKAEKAAEKEVWRVILAEDGIIEVDTDADGPVDDTAEISKLTGKPLPEDVILYAIPVCAPYQVLTQYKYRVKLTPGNQKRGKASKQCLEMFYRSEDQNKSRNSVNEKYIEMIKSVNDNDWVQAICGDVKISAAGASKAIKKQKAGKKK